MYLHTLQVFNIERHEACNNTKTRAAQCMRHRFIKAWITKQILTKLILSLIFGPWCGNYNDQSWLWLYLQKKAALIQTLVSFMATIHNLTYRSKVRAFFRHSTKYLRKTFFTAINLTYKTNFILKFGLQLRFYEVGENKF